MKTTENIVFHKGKTVKHNFLLQVSSKNYTEKLVFHNGKTVIQSFQMQVPSKNGATTQFVVYH